MVFFPYLWVKSQRDPINGLVPLNNNNSLILVKCLVQWNFIPSEIFSSPLAWAASVLDTELGRGT